MNGLLSILWYKNEHFFKKLQTFFFFFFLLLIDKKQRRKIFFFVNVIEWCAIVNSLQVIEFNQIDDDFFSRNFRLLFFYASFFISFFLDQDFFNQINILYGNITDYCTPQTCEVMSAGPKYVYLWADGQIIKKPIKVSAPEYVDYLMTCMFVCLDWYEWMNEWMKRKKEKRERKERIEITRCIWYCLLSWNQGFNRLWMMRQFFQHVLIKHSQRISKIMRKQLWKDYLEVKFMKIDWNAKETKRETKRETRSECLIALFLHCSRLF